jgi:hypothetical protein
MTPEELAAHEARHQPTRRGAVCRTCEGLWPCPSQRASSALREAWAEVARLRDWKAEALTVLADWEAVYEVLGRPGPLGASKAFAALVEVKSLREREARVRAVCDAEWDWKAGRSLHAALRAAVDGEA